MSSTKQLAVGQEDPTAITADELRIVRLFRSMDERAAFDIELFMRAIAIKFPRSEILPLSATCQAN